MSMVGSHSDMVERFSNLNKPKTNKNKIKSADRSRRDKRRNRHDY